MNKILKEKIMEAFTSVLPITVIVLVASVFLAPLPSGTILMFLGGAALLVVGMGFFTLGADMAMMPMGEGIGIQLTKSSKLLIIIFVSFLMGMLITMAEPDLQVLARQFPSVPSAVLIVTVAGGVGLFLVIAVLRPLLKIRLSVLLTVFYAIVFGLLAITPITFIPVAFDSGGVTTGPMTVPFILAMGVGVASIRSDRQAQDDTFGLVSLCSVGPIIAVLILGIFFDTSGSTPVTRVFREAETSRDVVEFFLEEIPQVFSEVIVALGAIIFCFILLQLVTRRFKKHQLRRIAMGFLYTLIGLVLFLTGVSTGFSPVGQLLGSQLGQSPYKWVLIPLGVVIGYFIVAAEPAVHVLNKQVEQLSAGSITQKMMNRALSIGMAGALALTMFRILYSVPIIYILIPGYAIAIGLSFFVPKMFTGIAFDSGGVCSGPMSTTFLLPFAMGTCTGVGGNLMIDAFGIVAMVAMTPLIVIQLMGLMYKLRALEAERLASQQAASIKFAEAGKDVDWGKIYVYEGRL
jgi:hypothetical protein